MQNVDELITEFLMNRQRPPFTFTYPVPIFSDYQISPEGIDRDGLESRNSFLKYAQSTDVQVMLERARVLLGLQPVIEKHLPRRIKTVSLLGSYVNPWNPGKRNDIDINLIFEGNGFYHIEIPARDIRQQFPAIPKEVEELEIVAIGDENAVSGKPTNDSFVTTTGRENVVPITVAGLWNRDVPIYGLDYRQIPDNEGNLLRLAYDLIESAIRRYQNRGLNKPESDLHRMRKALCRTYEARVYLEEVLNGSRPSRSKVSLLQDVEAHLPDELRFYVGHTLGETIKRYLQL